MSDVWKEVFVMSADPPHPTWTVAGDSRVVRLSGLCESPRGLCPITALIQSHSECRTGSRLAGAFFQSVAGSPRFFYYHKQIRGSGEHTLMQIAPSRLFQLCIIMGRAAWVAPRSLLSRRRILCKVAGPAVMRAPTRLIKRAKTKK